MSRRSTLENIDVAQRAGVRSRLVGERVDPDRADAWIAAWGPGAFARSRSGAGRTGTPAGNGSPRSGSRDGCR